MQLRFCYLKNSCSGKFDGLKAQNDDKNEVFILYMHQSAFIFA